MNGEKQVLYALIGCTGEASLHMKAAMAKDYDIVAVSDTRYPKMRELLGSLGMVGCDPDLGGLIGAVYTFTDYRQMITEKKPEVVSVTIEDRGAREEAVGFCKAGGVRVVEKIEEV